MASIEQNILPSHYYRDNFLRLVATVRERYGDLLHADEAQVLDTFDVLPFDAQCLYVRLVSRTGPWFRETKLDYPEITAIGVALDELLGAGLLEQAEVLDLAAMDRLFTRAELTTVFGAALGLPRSAGKAALLGAIESLGEEHDVDAMRTIDSGRIVAPRHVETMALLQVLFFGNRHQGLTEFVLEELGVNRYYPYALDRSGRKFASRAALDEYLACAQLGDLHRDLAELGLVDELVELGSAVAELPIEHESSRGRLDRLGVALGRDLERIGALSLADRLYRRSNRHPARERRARILERQQRFAEACGLCDEITRAPWCEAEHEAAQRIHTRAARKQGQGATPRRRDQFETLALTLPRGSQSVERTTAAHLEAGWTGVHYVENSLVNGLFGLAFWEVLFAPVAGQFHHAYQAGPADMYEPAFRTRRAAAIEERLETLRAVNFGEELQAAYRRYRHYRCQWVDWRIIDEALVSAATRVVPTEHWLAMFERLLFDPRENRRGLPDLVALGSEPGDYCFIEVKGPGDSLQDSQKRWLRFFAAHDIPARVAYVEWASAADD